jgi:hypothetical protein
VAATASGRPAPAAGARARRGQLRAQLANAIGGQRLRQPKAGSELLTGMASIADEVANGKINDPFTAHDVTLEEPCFSANSIADFQDNIRSLQNVPGDYGGHAGHGVMAAGSTPLMRGAEVQAAVDAIELSPRRSPPPSRSPRGGDGGADGGAARSRRWTKRFRCWSDSDAAGLPSGGGRATRQAVALRAPPCPSAALSQRSGGAAENRRPAR